MNVKKFLTELKRRNSHKVPISYATVGWLLMQNGNNWLIKGVFVRCVLPIFRQNLHGFFDR